MDKLIETFRNALIEFVNSCAGDGWRGRERESVNRFVFDNLLKLVSSHPLLRDPTQIGIEVTVPQVKSSGKKFVCKDLVIWPLRNQTAWTHNIGFETPLFIVEWKTRQEGFSKYDLEGLKLFTQTYPKTIGISVTLNRHKNDYSIIGALVQEGKIDRKWLKHSVTGPAIA
jgi:hypothetical protein